jgi:hypothetical protein
MIGPQTKNKSSFPYAHPSVPPELTSHSFVLIHPASKQRGCSSIRPFLQPSLLRAYSPGLKAAWLLIRPPLPLARARQATTLFPFPVASRAVRPRSLRLSPAW